MEEQQKAKLKDIDILQTYMFSKYQFALLKLGYNCNASTTQPFTDAKCYMNTIRKPNSIRTLTVDFSRIFRPGILLLKDWIEDKERTFSDYEKNAIQKLVEFLKKKGRLPLQTEQNRRGATDAQRNAIFQVSATMG